MALIFRADLWKCIWKQCHKTLQPWPRLRFRTFAARRRSCWNSWGTWRWRCLSCLWLKWQVAWLPNSPRSELLINPLPSLTRLRNKHSIRARSTSSWICGPRKHVPCAADSTSMKRTWKTKKQRGRSGCTYSGSTHLSIQGQWNNELAKRKRT